jgi:hypothetical protein
MEQTALTPFAAWESFYVIVGSSAAALTGLQFVVIVLGSELNMISGGAAGAFATPTIVHFCAVLLISAVLSAPWQALWTPALALSVCGMVGVVYSLLVIRWARLQKDYKPVLEDWLWHNAFPFVAYAALLVASILLRQNPRPALFSIGATALFLLFIGIHNAWDAVMYMAVQRRQSQKEQ